MNKSDKRLFAILILGVIFLFIRNVLYGHSMTNLNNKYFGYLLISTFVTVLTINIIKHKKLKLNVWIKICKSFIIYSFFMYGLCLFLFGIINRKFSEEEELKYKVVKIADITEKTSRSLNQISFLLNGDTKMISVTIDDKVSKLLRDTAALNNSYLSIKYRKGLLGTYIIEEKDIIFGKKY